MKYAISTRLVLFAAALTIWSGLGQAAPTDTGFSYQGQLKESGNPANGEYDIQFSLWDAGDSGNQIGALQQVSHVSVSNGLLTAILDFGPGVFDGNARWLEIALRTNGSASAYTALAPRQSVSSAPYSIYSHNAAALNGQSSTSFAPASGSTAYVAKTGDAMSGALSVPANGFRAGGNQFVLANGNVGIGTASPAARLDVAGPVAVNGTTIVDAAGKWVGNITLTGNLKLPALAATNGIVYAGADTLLHGDGNQNFFAGIGAGNLNSTGMGNIGLGGQALSYDTSGSYNTANGYLALKANTTGSGNTASGYEALFANTTGSNNTAEGIAALFLNQSGSGNIALGKGAGGFVTGDDNVAIGNIGVAGESGTIRIGTLGTHTSAVVAGIYGAPVANGQPVFVGPFGQLGSSADVNFNSVAINGATIINAAGNWVGSPIGLQGPPGPQGPTGLRGPTGLQGPMGPKALNWFGAWNSSTAYTTNDAVQYNGSAWMALRASTGVAPVAGSTWSLLAQKGDPGPQGATGQPGPPGPNATLTALGIKSGIVSCDTTAQPNFAAVTFGTPYPNANYAVLLTGVIYTNAQPGSWSSVYTMRCTKGSSGFTIFLSFNNLYPPSSRLYAEWMTVPYNNP